MPLTLIAALMAGGSPATLPVRLVVPVKCEVERVEIDPQVSNRLVIEAQCNVDSFDLALIAPTEAGRILSAQSHQGRVEVKASSIRHYPVRPGLSRIEVNYETPLRREAMPRAVMQSL